MFFVISEISIAILPIDSQYQRWSPRGRPWPRGHILKSLASKPQVLENCPVLGSRTALFLNRWNFVGKRQKLCGKSTKTFFLVSSSRDRLKKIFWRRFSPEKSYWRPFFFEIAWKKFLRTFFFGEHLCLCPWSRNFFVSMALASSIVSSTPPLVNTDKAFNIYSLPPPTHPPTSLLPLSKY